MIRFRYAVVTAGLLFTVAPILEAQDGELPAQLAQLAEELGCRPIPGFYASPGMVDPPYIYGYLPGNREDSAVFWCHRPGDGANLLVAVRSGRVANHIIWEYHFPHGLSLAKDTAFDLGDFRYVDDPSAYGPAGARPDYPPLVSQYDGVPTFFYEYQGRWLFWMLD